MALPNITIVGNTTAPPELRFTPSGKAVASLTVVANKRKKTDAGGWEDAGRSPFIRVSVWGQEGEELCEALPTEGTAKVIVTGQLLARTYEDREGNTKESIELDYATVGVVPTPKRSDRENGRAGRRPADNQGADPWATPAPSQDPWATPSGSDEPPF